MEDLDEALMTQIQLAYLHNRYSVASELVNQSDSGTHTAPIQGVVMDRQTRQALRDRRFTLIRELLLRALSRAGRPMNQQQLAHRLHLQPPHIADALKQMEREGELRRSRNPEDRREVLYTLTEKGASHAARQEEIRKAKSSEFLKPLSQDEKETLLLLLDKLSLTEDFGLRHELDALRQEPDDGNPVPPVSPAG